MINCTIQSMLEMTKNYFIQAYNSSLNIHHKTQLRRIIIYIDPYILHSSYQPIQPNDTEREAVSSYARER